jgi:hypothetical protein
LLAPVNAEFAAFKDGTTFCDFTENKVIKHKNVENPTLNLENNSFFIHKNLS